MSMRHLPAYENLAFVLIHDGLKEEDLLKRGFAFKRDRSFKDVIKAVRKGINAGLGSTEEELKMITLYLRQILKVAGRV